MLWAEGCGVPGYDFDTCGIEFLCIPGDGGSATV